MSSETGYTITVHCTTTGKTTTYATDAHSGIDQAVTLAVAYHHHRHHGDGQPYTWQIGTPAQGDPAVTYLLTAAPGVPGDDYPQPWQDLRGRHPFKLRVTAPDGTITDVNRSGPPQRAYAVLHQATADGPWTVIAFVPTAQEADTKATRAGHAGDQYAMCPAETITPGDSKLATGAPWPDRLDQSSPVYPYLRAWCRRLGSSYTYTQQQIATAIFGQAPPTAIYQDTSGVWHTAESIASRQTWEQIDARVKTTHGGHMSLGPYPWHETEFTIRVRIPVIAWSEGGAFGEDDFQAYVTAWISGINDGTAELMPRVRDLGGTVEAKH